jgi:ABC-type branched-subunit amino acid transport system permease subunit
MTKAIVEFLGIGVSPGFPLWAVVIIGGALFFLGFFAAALLATSFSPWASRAEERIERDFIERDFEERAQERHSAREEAFKALGINRKEGSDD